MKLKHIFQISILCSFSAVHLYFLISAEKITFPSKIKQENSALNLEIKHLEVEINNLKNQIFCWENNENYTIEKYAREELCMGKTDEIIYFLPKTT